MLEVGFLVAGMLFLPLGYGLMMSLYKTSFMEEINRTRRIGKSFLEIVVLAAAEAAFFRIWWQTFKASDGMSVIAFLLLYTMLVGMTFFCVTDYWEKIVPNRALLVLLLLWIILVGMYGVRNPDKIMPVIAGAVLGLVFCVISFGFCYLLSRGSMGAGDVKLSLVMGLYLTGEYVVGTVLYGCMICAAYSIVMLLRKKLSRKDTIPFVPFLYIGMILRYLIG